MGDLAHDLTDALAGEGGLLSVTAPLPAEEQRSGPATAHVQSQKARQFGTHRHFVSLAALAILEDNDAFSQAHVFDAQRHEFRHPRARLQQHLHHLARLGRPVHSLGQ